MPLASINFTNPRTKLYYFCKEIAKIDDSRKWMGRNFDNYPGFQSKSPTPNISVPSVCTATRQISITKSGIPLSFQNTSGHAQTVTLSCESQQRKWKNLVLRQQHAFIFSVGVKHHDFILSSQARRKIWGRLGHVKHHLSLLY